MHFAAKNLLYTIHQSLDAQFVTVSFFKRYARSPENKTFKNYFRPSAANSWTRPGRLFTSYTRKRPGYSLSRYITLHKRKKNPILQSFNQTKTTIIERLQQLRPVLNKICENRCNRWTKKTQNKPNSKHSRNGVSRLSSTDYCSPRTDNCQKNKPNQTHFPPSENCLTSAAASDNLALDKEIEN
ncbi:MAG: hypothetical protein ACYTCN_10550 [Planctomycetota bacterium]|jgi:hypothetical protein